MTEKLYVAEEHIWVTADRSRAVDVSDPDAALLHTPTGHSMPSAPTLSCTTSGPPSEST